MNLPVLNPLITEDEDIVNMFVSFEPYPGRVVVHLTLSEGYGEISRQLILATASSAQAEGVINQLKHFLNLFEFPDDLGDARLPRSS